MQTRLPGARATASTRRCRGTAGAAASATSPSWTWTRDNERHDVGRERARARRGSRGCVACWVNAGRLTHWIVWRGPCAGWTTWRVCWVFHAAVAQVQSVEQHGRPSAATHSRTAWATSRWPVSSSRRASGPRARSTSCSSRAIHTATSGPRKSRHRDAGEAVELWYVSGDPVLRALRLREEQGIRNRAVELIEAERDRDVDAVDAVIGGLTTRLVAERVPLHAAGGHPSARGTGRAWR